LQLLPVRLDPQTQRQRRATRFRQGRRPGLRKVHPAMKSFRERNPIIIGAVAVALTAVVAISALNYNRLPFFSTGTTYSAYFDDAGGLVTDAPVQVSGLRAGKVRSITLDPRGVLVSFTVDDNIRLGDRTEAAIKTISLLGNKILEVSPR